VSASYRVWLPSSSITVFVEISGPHGEALPRCANTLADVCAGHQVVPAKQPAARGALGAGRGQESQGSEDISSHRNFRRRNIRDARVKLLHVALSVPQLYLFPSHFKRQLNVDSRSMIWEVKPGALWSLGPRIDVTSMFPLETTGRGHQRPTTGRQARHHQNPHHDQYSHLHKPRTKQSQASSLGHRGCAA